MSDTALRIALAQIDTCVGDLTGNTRAVLERSREAAEAGARLVVFPEMTVTGYPIEDLALRASFRRAADRAVADLAAALAAAGLGDLTVVVGTVGSVDIGSGERTGAGVTVPEAPARPTNQAAVLRGGRVVQRYDKQHLPNYGVFDEYRIFAPGSRPCVVEVDGYRVGLAVCEDIWRDGPVEALVGERPDLLVVLNGSPYEEGKTRQRTDLAAVHSARLGVPVAYVNMVGGQDDLVFDGGSFVVTGTSTTDQPPRVDQHVGPQAGPHVDQHPVRADVLARAPQFEETLLVWDLPPAGTAPGRGPSAAPLHPDEEVYRALVTGLAGYVRKNGFRKVVLGMSGGIDSALVAAVAADAIGGENVTGVSMPSRWSSDHSRDDAADLAARIGAEYRVQPIKPMVDAFESEMALDGIAAENIQARVRGMILMAVSNAEGHLVLATGNKTELAVGYSTIYGDAVGGYAPIKDVDKSRVWALSRWRNHHAVDAGQIPPIPESSITKPPSAELRPGQVDQDSLPPYDVLDQVLDAYVEHAEGREELLARGFDPAVVDRVLSLVDRAEWKRRQYPPGPKVTALAFGRDRRLPVTTRWREPLGPDAAGPDTPEDAGPPAPTT